MEAKKINYKKLSEIEHTISGIIKYFNGYPKKLNSKDFNQLILETSELQLLQKELNLTNADLKYCLVKGTVPYPKYCVVCGKQVHIKEHDLMKGYPSTCCRECSFKDPERNKKILALNLDPENIKRKVAKTKQTCLKKYGVASAFQVKEIKDKIVKTNIEKYGAANPFASDIIKEKIKATNLERYGVEQVLANKEIKAKAEQAMIDKYGVKNIFHNVDFIKSRLLEKYGVENIMKLPSIVKTLEENILKKYGVANISELNETKLQKLKTHCHTIYTLIVKRCKEEFEDKITPLFSEEDYFNLRRSDKYKYASTNLMWKCNVCGEVFEDYYANGEIPICPKCNPGVKRGLQNEILNYIQNIYKGNIVTEDRSIINPLELDIYIPELKLAIEIDGDYWHSENRGVDKFYHLNKTKLCEEKGIKLIHIFEYQWKYRKDQVIYRLNNLFNYFPDNNRIYARKCVIKLVKNSVANAFLDQQHLQGAINSKVNLGLYYNDELVALMTFGKPRFNKNYQWELLRYCSKGRVIGGASKLLKYFEKEYKPSSLISYADRCWTSKLHNVYSSIGFTYTHDSEPGYIYTKRGSVLTRYQCQKYKLKDLLGKDNFDPNKSETDNMLDNGFLKLYDCGNLVFVKEYQL